MPQGFEELLIFKIANYVIDNKDQKPDSPREEEYNTARGLLKKEDVSSSI